MNKDLTFPSWVEINLDNIYQNVVNLKSHSTNLAKRNIKFMAVIKADGYGHGAIECASACLKAGADYLAVAILHEALLLRQVYKNAPILILGVSTHPNECEAIVKNRLTATITNLKFAKKLNEVSKKYNRKTKIHVKIDTGMGRAGIFPKNGLKFFTRLKKFENLEIEGIYTHLSSSDSNDKSYSYYQKDQFANLLNTLVKYGFSVPLVHISNSGAIIDLQPEFAYNMVRAGISIYGFYPSDEVIRKNVKLQPALSWFARIGSLKVFEKDMYISYSRTYKTEEKCKMAVLPVGYADGYSRALSNNSEVLINGKRFPLVGRVCMDAVVIKLPSNERVKLYQKATLIGVDKDQEIHADDMAKRIDTINYEITCMISKRVPRVYIKNGNVWKIKKYTENLF